MSKQDKSALRYLNTKGITNYREKMRIIGTLKHDVPNLRLSKGKFVTAGLRMYFNHDLSDEQSIRSLGTVLNYIHKGNHTSEYDFNLNGLTLEELSSKYKDNIAIDRENDRKRSEQIQRNGGNGYTIISIGTYKQAHKYSQYTSWCVTNDENAFDSYTQVGNRFYFCLINGFENIHKNDEGAPLNAYGLSMIAVNIDMNGDLLRITTRYNHEFGGENNDGLCSVAQLENILDVNFYKVFLPYTREELHSRGIIMFDEVQGLLDKYVEPCLIFNDIFDESENYRVVELNDKWNWVNKDNRLVSPNQWYDKVEDFHEGYAVVELNNKYNFIDTNGNYLSDQWFDLADDFINGYAVIKLNNKWNWINTKCNYLSKQWFDEVEVFYYGYANVKLNNKWNWIDTKCNYISEQWFDNVFRFHDGYANVKLNNKWNWIDTKCNYITEQWFDYVYDFNDGYARVELNCKYNLIDTNCNYLSEQWFDLCDDFSNGYARVDLNNKYNFIDTNGNYLNEQWFDWCSGFYNGYAVVKLNGKYNLIYTTGDYLSEQWFDWYSGFDNGYATVKLNGKWNFIDKNGKYINEQWFDSIKQYKKGCFKVEINEKIYFLTDKGELLENIFTIPTLVA